MKEIFENVINSQEYDLRDILNKLDEYYVKNLISKEEKEYLEERARMNAKAENSYSDTQTQLDEIFERLLKLENEVFKNQEEATEEYPEFKQPTNSTDAYQKDDKITFKGKKYVCQIDNCVWNPEEYPNAWLEVREEGEL